MNISNIEKFVADQNAWNKIFGNYRPLSLLNAEDRQTIAMEIDMRLSPENLTCDGELSRSQVQARFNFLSRCAQELVSIDPSIEFCEFY